MWSSMKSLMLSRVINIILFVFFVGLLFYIPFLAEYYDWYSITTGFVDLISIAVPTMIMLYTVDIMVIAALVYIYRLLGNISKNEVFIPDNTNYIRIISWICMGIGVIFAIYGILRCVFFVPAAIVIFIGFILRVVKNVFENAVELKSENDLMV